MTRSAQDGTAMDLRCIGSLKILVFQIALVDFNVTVIARKRKKNF